MRKRPILIGFEKVEIENQLGDKLHKYLGFGNPKGDMGNFPKFSAGKNKRNRIR